jgi:hypothetical protein
MEAFASLTHATKRLEVQLQEGCADPQEVQQQVSAV